MSSVIADLRYAARELRRRPGFALTAVLSLALGIGATSAVFSVVYGVLINPFPYVGADRMMQLALRDDAGRFRYPGMTGAQLDQLRQARTVESVVGEDGWNLTTTDGDIPEDVVASYISPNAPNHWGVPTLMGRWLIPADARPGQEPARVVVLGYQFWQRYYAGDPAVVGRTIQLVRKNYQIVGVMPPRFRWRDADIYVPLKVSFEPNIYYGVNLKIRPDVSLEQANAELQPILAERRCHRLCVIFDNVASRWVTESSRDPLILGGVTVLLSAVAIMACLAPARRAASIDPMEACDTSNRGGPRGTRRDSFRWSLAISERSSARRATVVPARPHDHRLGWYVLLNALRPFAIVKLPSDLAGHVDPVGHPVVRRPGGTFSPRAGSTMGATGRRVRRTAREPARAGEVRASA